jgi:hypothetical protein
MPAVPTFPKSPPELVARFDELAPLAGRKGGLNTLKRRAPQNGHARCRVTACAVRR